MDLDPSVVWDFAGTLVGTFKQRPRQLPATVSRVDTDGTVWLSMPGADGLVPASTTADVSADDSVTVEWWGNAYHVTGNGTSPSVGTRAAAALRRATAAAAKVAGEAKGIADAVGQHFWSDDNGVHVSNEDGNATGERNILMNSLGILLRQGSAWLASFSDSAVAFYDGLGNEAANIVAQFGADGAVIGRAGESYQTLDYHSLQLVDKEGKSYFHVSDLRDHSGTAEITVVFTGDGSKRTFSFDFIYPDDTSYTVTVSDGSGGTPTKSTYSFVFPRAPSDGATISATYKTSSTLAKAYTAGFRHTDEGGHANIGAMSFAEGYDVTSSGGFAHSEGAQTVASSYAAHSEGVGSTASQWTAHAEGWFTKASGYNSHAEGWDSVAKGDRSHAQNKWTIAAYDDQTTIGRFNANDPDNALEVGNGTADNARSNALTVDWDGNVMAQAMAGIIQMFAGATPPSGWLVCDGSAVSRDTYSTLFAAIGTTWGTGDGSTTFNLPDLRGRAPIGAGTGSGLTARTLGTQNIGSENVQAHTHSISRTTNVAVSDSGHTHPAATSDYYYAIGSATFAKQSGTAQSGSSGLTNAVRQNGTLSNNKNTGSGKASLSVTQPVFSVGAVSGATTGTAGNMQPSAVVNFIICTGKTS